MCVRSKSCCAFHAQNLFLVLVRHAALLCHLSRLPALEVLMFNAGMAKSEQNWGLGLDLEVSSLRAESESPEVRDTEEY